MPPERPGPIGFVPFEDTTLTIRPLSETPNLWFTVDGVAYRLDEPEGWLDLGTRHRALARALLAVATERLKVVDP
jgi:hypothetical protein